MLTQQQNNAVDAVLRDGRHVVLTALPGCGKSKVAYAMIEQCEDTNILMLAYNRGLNDKSNTCIQALGLPPTKHVRSYTFHGLLSTLTGTLCCNDEQFTNGLEVLEKNGTSWDRKDFTLLILDETQDIRPSYFKLVRMLVRSVCTHPDKLRIVLLGDKNQLLYNFYHFDRADARFLTLGALLFRTVNTRTWESLQLTQSFRSTFAVSSFLNALVPNHCMQPRNMHACEPVELYICNTYTDPSRYILNYVNDTISPANILILCPSLNERSPAKAVVRTLIRNNVQVMVNRSGKLSDNIEHSNINVAPLAELVHVKTYCASKGLEAPLVIIIHSRRSLFEAIDNSTYVALSRSIQKLVIFHDRTFTTHEQVCRLYKNLPDIGTCIVHTHIVPQDTAQATVHISKLSDINVMVAENTILNRNQLQKQPDNTRPEYKTVQQLFTYLHTSVLQTVRQNYETEVVSEPLEDVVYEGVDLCVKQDNGTTYIVDANTDTMSVPHIVNVDGVFAREFEVGPARNMMGIVGNVCHFLIEYHLSRRIRLSIRRLGRIYHTAADTYAHEIYNSGMSHLKQCPVYAGDIYTLAHYIPTFTFLAVSSDAWYGFEDRIHAISDFSFVQKPSVVERILRILRSVVGDIFTYPISSGMLYKSKHVDVSYSVNVDGQMTDHKMKLDDKGDNLVCCVGSNGLMVTHTPYIDDTLRTLACCRLYMYGIDTVYVCNTWTGAVERVSRKPQENKSDLAVLTTIVSAVMQKDVVLDDISFVATFACK